MGEVREQVTYRQLTAFDPCFRFTGFWSFDRAKVMGFVRQEKVPEYVKGLYMRRILDHGVAKVFEGKNPFVLFLQAKWSLA